MLHPAVAAWHRSNLPAGAAIDDGFDTVAGRRFGGGEVKSVKLKCKRGVGRSEKAEVGSRRT